MKHKILNVKNPILRKKSREVKNIDKKTRKLVSDMWETLESQNDPEGIGLAAPQIGKNYRIFIMNHEGEKRTVINPKVLKVGKAKKIKFTKNTPLEGCLSLPHFYGPVDRANEITIAYLNEKGIKKTEKFTGFLAYIVQHELDHLEGVIFVDHILEQSSKLYKYEAEGWEEVELV